MFRTLLVTWHWPRRQGSPWLLLPAAAGRIYAAYGGVYVAVAMIWLWRVDRAPITGWDLTGAAVSIAGMGIIVRRGWRV
jgi:small multidrug resistance family-3 protein